MTGVMALTETQKAHVFVLISDNRYAMIKEKFEGDFMETDKIKIRPLQSNELKSFWQLAFSNPHAEWTKWNGPIFMTDCHLKLNLSRPLAQKNGFIMNSTG